MKIRAKGKVKDLAKEELEKSFFEDLFPKRKVKIELKEEKKMKKNVELLESSVLPAKNLIKIERLKGYNTEFPCIGEKPIKISYLVESLLKITNYDFDLLKNLVDSKFSSEIFLKNLGIEESPKAKFFIEKCLYSSNSKDSLALFLGYELLLPNKITKIEERLENEKKIFNVYTHDLRGIDAKIIGVGISILKHLKIRGIIKPCYY